MDKKKKVKIDIVLDDEGQRDSLKIIASEYCMSSSEFIRAIADGIITCSINKEDL